MSSRPQSHLRRRLIEEMPLRGFAKTSIRTYSWSISHQSRFYGRSPDGLSDEEVRAYLVHLVEAKNAARDTQNVALAAARFLYLAVLGRDVEALRVARLSPGASRRTPCRPSLGRRSGRPSTEAASDDPLAALRVPPAPHCVARRGLELPNPRPTHPVGEPLRSARPDPELEPDRVRIAPELGRTQGVELFGGSHVHPMVPPTATLDAVIRARSGIKDPRRHPAAHE